MAISRKSGTYAAAQTAQQTATPKLQVKIFSPYQTFYQGEAVSLSALNDTGPFDILPGHVNFFCLVAEGNVTINTGFQQLTFQVGKGILRVSTDHITLFANV
jgi:F0F1-type ATP synthase epsilon subunit